VTVPRSDVRAIAFSYDGNTIATVGSDGLKVLMADSSNRFTNPMIVPSYRYGVQKRFHAFAVVKQVPLSSSLPSKPISLYHGVGYGLTLAFAPGGRYVIVGTKQGHIQVYCYLLCDTRTNEPTFYHPG
jgi:hypothetical protein